MWGHPVEDNITLNMCPRVIFDMNIYMTSQQVVSMDILEDEYMKFTVETQIQYHTNLMQNKMFHFLFYNKKTSGKGSGNSLMIVIT